MDSINGSFSRSSATDRNLARFPSKFYTAVYTEKMALARKRSSGTRHRRKPMHRSRATKVSFRLLFPSAREGVKIQRQRPATAGRSPKHLASNVLTRKRDRSSLVERPLVLAFGRNKRRKRRRTAQRDQSRQYVFTIHDITRGVGGEEGDGVPERVARDRRNAGKYIVVFGRRRCPARRISPDRDEKEEKERRSVSARFATRINRPRRSRFFQS